MPNRKTYTFSYTFQFWLLLGVIAILLFQPLHIPWMRGEEPRRVIVALEMLFNRQWVIPTINDFPYFNKPPLYNWFIAASADIFNDTGFRTIRIPTIVALLGIGILLFYIIKQFLQPSIALFVSLGTVCSADIFLFFSIRAEIDIFYTFIVLCQVLSIFYFSETRKNYPLLYLVSYFFCALGVLTKGLPSIAFQVFTLITLGFSIKDWKFFFRWSHLFGILLFSGLLGLYFYAFSLKQPVHPFLVNLFEESAKRVSSDQNYSYLFLFPLSLLKLLTPWTLFIIFIRRIPSHKTIYRFSWIFILLNIWIYWLSPVVKDRYLYMFMPFILLFLMTWWINSCQQKSFILIQRILIYIFLPIPLIVIIAFYFSSYYLSFEAKWILIPFILIFTIIIISYLSLGQKIKFGLGYVLLVTMISLRILFNVIYLPIVQKNSSKNEVYAWTQNVARTVGKQSLYYAATKYSDSRSIYIFGRSIINTEVPVLSDYPWEITYYLMDNLQKPIPHSINPPSGSYGIALESWITRKDLEIISRLQQSDYAEDMIFFRMN